MAKTNRTCKVCGLKYYYCPACSATRANPQPKWKINYCSEDCKNIFEIVVEYNCNTINSKEAFERLKDCDTTRFDGFTDDIKRVIEEVTKDNTKVKAVEKKYNSENKEF